MHLVITLDIQRPIRAEPGDVDTDPETPSAAADELTRRLAARELTGEDLTRLLRSMESGAVAGGEEAAGAGGGSDRRTDERQGGDGSGGGAGRASDPGAGGRVDPAAREMLRLREAAAAELADLYPARFRQVVARYFDPGS